MSWFMKLASAAAVTGGAFAIATLMFALHQQWLVVYVESPQDLCVPIVIPVPLSAISTAAAFIPEADRKIELPRDLPVDFDKAAEMVRLLRDCPDTDFVRVTTPTENVLIRKEGDRLRILVKTDRENVQVELPFEFIEEALKTMKNKDVTPGQLADSLSHLRYTQVVQVDTPDQKVRIWSW
jgi:hypothetical protein